MKIVSEAEYARELAELGQEKSEAQAANIAAGKKPSDGTLKSTAQHERLDVLSQQSVVDNMQIKTNDGADIDGAIKAAMALGAVGTEKDEQSKDAKKKIAERKAVKKAAGKAAKEAGEKAGKEAAEKTAKEVMEKALSEGMSEKAAKEMAEKAAKEAAKKAAMEAAKKAAMETAKGTFGKKSAEKLAKKAAEKISEEIAEKAAKEAMEKVAKEVAEKGIGKIGTKIAAEVVEKGAEKGLLKAVSKGILFGAKKIPVVGAVVTAIEGVGVVGYQALTGHPKVAMAEAVAYTAEAAGNVLGFGAGEVSRQAAVEAVDYTTGVRASDAVSVMIVKSVTGMGDPAYDSHIPSSVGEAGEKGKADAKYGQEYVKEHNIGIKEGITIVADTQSMKKSENNSSLEKAENSNISSEVLMVEATLAFVVTEKGREALIDPLGDDGGMSLKEAELFLEKNSEEIGIDYNNLSKSEQHTLKQELTQVINDHAGKLSEKDIQEMKDQYESKHEGAKDLIADIGAALSDSMNSISTITPNVAAQKGSGTLEL